MVVSPDEGGGSGAPDADLSPGVRARLRSTLTGAIFVMSVLAYLGNHTTGLVTAVVTVVGTGLVIFFGEAYAGLLSAGLASTGELPRAEIREELATSSMAAAPGIVAGVLLLLVDLLGGTVQTGVAASLWAGVATLTVLSVAEARSSHRSLLVRIASVAGSVLVGLAVIGLKAALH